MFKTSYILKLGQLFKIALKFKRYLWQKLKLEKTQNLNKATTQKQVNYLVPKLGTIALVMDNHVVVIQVHIGKNTSKDVLLDGGFGVHHIIVKIEVKASKT